MTIQEYINKINERYKLGNATEHTYRGDLQNLIESLVNEITVTNEAKRQACGAPDYIIMKGQIPIGYIEAKNIDDKDLYGKNKSGNKEQFDRYKDSLNNIIFTDYLSFVYYKNASLVQEIKIAEISPKGIIALTENFADFEKMIKNFCSTITQTIKNSSQLAKMMAGKARLLADIIEKAIDSDERSYENTSLRDQMIAFKQILIHDISSKAFADIYAQTIAYGMFAARLHDPTLPTFSRQEAAELIPKSNPFLRRLFSYIAGPDLDDRILWIVDDLIEIFLASNVEELLKNYGKETKTEDPIIHFYETFLSEYDAKLRKARGVWYTPQPVVNFIVRAVDEILKSEFELPQGLADNSKIKIKTNQQGKDIEQEVHRVQILDPATGTGTFLAEVVKHIHKKFKGQQGIWSNYVENHLIPRLNGFELLMASYAMAHLKLDLLLKETGYNTGNSTSSAYQERSENTVNATTPAPPKEGNNAKAGNSKFPSSGGVSEGRGGAFDSNNLKNSNSSKSNQRFRIYLTNSLEESHPDTGTLFASWLSAEANEANHIKRDTPVMCVIGNPPYAVSSTNKNEWIQNLIADYKKNLNEKKINLDDDYIKFIRYGQYFVDKNKSGVLAYISNNSFIDGITHRQMRKHLLESFDKIYILDLHGNAKKKETSPDGSADQNVFDIMQGVSINIFVKTGLKKQKELAQVYHFDLFGKRDLKYNLLTTNTMNSINWKQLEFTKPNYFFVPKNFDEANEYEKGIKVDDLFLEKISGVETKVDHIAVDLDKDILEERVNDIISNRLSLLEIKSKYKLSDKSTWEFNPQIVHKYSTLHIRKYAYRCFDFRYVYYNNEFLSRSRYEIQKHLLKENVAIILPRMCKGNGGFQHGMLSKYIVDRAFGDAYSGAGTNVFPLYLYLDTGERVPNLNMEIVNQISEQLGLSFVSEKEQTLRATSLQAVKSFSPIDILDYIYAVLHSPTYREKYKEFLKIDFPRVPYPKSQETFWQLVDLGSQIRQIHLLESPVVEDYITEYPADGDNLVDKIKYQDGKVYINASQFFANVPEVAWNFYIGGYQPAQKWLKDRKGRTLEFDDILHYQKIIVALTETDKLMKEIDKIEIE